MAAVDKLGKQAVHARAAISCLGGQTVTLLSGRSRTAVTDMTASVDGPNTIEPEIEQILSGTTLAVLPRIAGDSAVVDLVSAVGEWDGPPGPIGPPVPARLRAQAGEPPGPAPMTVDRIDAVVQDLRTTARVPLGKAILVGGMTLQPTAHAEGAAGPGAKGGPADKGDARQLYLVLRVTSKESPAPEPEKARGDRSA